MQRLLYDNWEQCIIINSTKELQSKDCNYSIKINDYTCKKEKKKYIYSNAKSTLWQLRTMYNNHLLKVQGWGEWTLMRVWSVSYRFHPKDWCHPRQCLHGSLPLGHPQTQCYRPSLQILLFDLWTILDLCFRRLWRLSCWWIHTSSTRWVFQCLQWNIYMFHL